MSTIIDKKVASNKIVYSYKAYIDLSQDEKHFKPNVRVDVSFDESNNYYFVNRVDDKYVNVENQNGVVMSLINDQIKVHLPLEFKTVNEVHETIENDKEDEIITSIPPELLEKKTENVTIVKTHLRKKGKRKKD
jgi:hypothetical protein